MNKVLSELKSYELRNTKNYNLEKGNVTKDLKSAVGPMEITKECSEVIDKVDELKVLPLMGSYLRSIREFVNSLRLVDETAKLSYTNDNLRRIGNMDKILEQETIYFGKENIEDLEAKFYTKYDNVKKGLKEIKNAIAEQEKIISASKLSIKIMKVELRQLRYGDIVSVRRLKKEIYNTRVRLNNARLEKLKLGVKIAALKNLSEKNIVDMARDINKSNRSGISLRIFGGISHIAANIILAMALPISKIAVTILQLPLVVIKLFKAIDIHIFRKLREKSEFSRKKQMEKEQIKNIEKEIGTKRFSEIVDGEKDLAKQLEKIEKTEDEDIKHVFETSRKAQNVLYAKPKWSLRMFKIKAIEDNERMENVAKFIIKQIKELPDEDRAREVLEKEDIILMEKAIAKRELQQAKESKERIKAMLEVLGMDNADDFIKEVKEYKTKKMEDLENLKKDNKKMDNEAKWTYADKKNKLKDKLVEAMKQKL